MPTNLRRKDAVTILLVMNIDATLCGTQKSRDAAVTHLISVPLEKKDAAMILHLEKSRLSVLPEKKDAVEILRLDVTFHQRNAILVLLKNAYLKDARAQKQPNDLRLVESESAIVCRLIHLNTVFDQ
jgi:hypothetical protein